MPINHLQFADTYHYPVVAHEFIKTRGVGLALILGTTLFVAAVEDFEVVVIHAVASKDISDEFHDAGLPDSSLSNKKNRVWCLRFILGSFDDSLLERRRVARNYKYSQIHAFNV
jgi:hypothetical protein